jgi:Tol biopolymer transport system component
MLRSARFDGFADYSPDGRRIAFASARSGSLEVWVCSSDGGDCVQLTSLRAAFTGFPRWSPDGQRIAFFSNADGHSDIYVVPATGGTPRWLAPDPADDILPSWARDGYSIYFASNRTGRYQVWKAPVFESGVGAAQVTRQGGLAAFESNDGRFLYYTKDHKFATALWRVPLSATGAPAGAETLVTQPVLAAGFAVTSRGLYYLVPGPYSVTAASIHFLSFSGGRTELVAALGKPAHQGLSVAPDGRSILYTQIDRPGQAVMLVENFR